MPPKRAVIGRNTADAKRKRAQRAVETPEQREVRLESNRLRERQSRAVETPEQHEARLEQVRIKATTRRAAETPQQHENRLEGNQLRAAQSRQRIDFQLAAFNYDKDCDYSNHPNVVIGLMSTLCFYCHALKFQKESPGMCCSNGKVKLSSLVEPPEPLISYVSGNTALSKHFLGNIRKYNSSFQMTSFGATNIVSNTDFTPTFKVQEQVYHQIGLLLPIPDQDSKFLQIYFTGDEEEEIDQRCAVINGTRCEIISNLQRLFHQHNYLVKLFKVALDQMPSDNYKVIIRADKTLSGEHERRFNAPTINEVAVVMVGTEFDRRDIIIQRRNTNLQRVSETHRSYDALQYPILFWQGEDGYHFNVMQINSVTGAAKTKKVSSMDYYAYRIMIRAQQSNHILKCRELFHQFIVDMYAKIESEWLLYIYLNQNKLRIEDYIHLRDAIANDGNAANIGQMCILPASYTGSPRHMHEYAQDALTYVRRYGRPDLFITFTCNSAWSDIKDLLSPGQSSHHRHDLIARVFKQKLMKLMDLIIKNRIYGEVQCWMYSIEWQKRGLPHAHILIWLKEKIVPTQIDSVISAELPNQHEDPILFDVVCKNMIHGPCGALNMSSPCMKDSKCTKKYPRDLNGETQTGEDGYPKYRRRKPENGGFTTTITVRNVDIDIDNRWIVPYSPILSKTFQAHINVEYIYTATP